MKINSFYIELTNQCNFDCGTCYNRSGASHAPVYLEFQALRSIMELAPTISLAGGEPLLYPYYKELIDFIGGHPDTSFVFITNGSMNRILADYERYPNIRLQVSLDGSCEEVNARTRGANHYDATARFIQEAAAIRPLTVKMVISGNNAEDIEPFYRKVMGWGCRPVFSFVINSGNALDRWGTLDLTPREKVRILKLLETLGAEYANTAELPYCTHHCPLMDKQEPLNLLVTSDGRIQPCQSLYNEAFTLGTIQEFSIERTMDRIADMAAARREADYGCYRCLIRSQCHHGCGALAFNSHGDFMACDENCDFRKQQFLHFLQAHKAGHHASSGSAAGQNLR